MAFPSAAPAFTILGKRSARVVGIHDGDTINCILNYSGFYKFPVRMDGIDTPEMTSKDEDLKKRALLARQRIFELITNSSTDTLGWKKKDFDSYFTSKYHEVSLDCKGLDKYGRLLASIGDPSFSSILVREGLAYPYSGKTKLTEQEQLQLK
jgi:endonuclease YncB( thermonuclease family)